MRMKTRIWYYSIVAVLPFIFGLGFLYFAWQELREAQSISHKGKSLPPSQHLKLDNLNKFEVTTDKGISKSIKELTSPDNALLHRILGQYNLIDRNDKWLRKVNTVYSQQWQASILESVEKTHPTKSEQGYSEVELPHWEAVLVNLAEDVQTHLNGLAQTVNAHREIVEAVEALVDQLLDMSGYDRASQRRKCRELQEWLHTIKGDLSINEGVLERVKHIGEEARLASRWLKFEQGHASIFGSWLYVGYAFGKRFVAGYVGPWNFFAIHIIWALMLLGPVTWWLLRSIHRRLVRYYRPTKPEKDLDRYYDKLGITQRPTTAEQIKQAYEQRISEFRRTSTPVSPLVKRAYKFLSDPIKRADYDERYGYNRANAESYRRVNDAQSYYTVLGIKPTDDKSVIERAYNSAKRLWKDEPTMWELECHTAHEILKSSEKKKAYDQAYGYNNPPGWIDAMLKKFSRLSSASTDRQDEAASTAELRRQSEIVEVIETAVPEIVRRLSEQIQSRRSSYATAPATPGVQVSPRTVRPLNSSTRPLPSPRTPRTARSSVDGTKTFASGVDWSGGSPRRRFKRARRDSKDQNEQDQTGKGQTGQE